MHLLALLVSILCAPIVLTRLHHTSLCSGFGMNIFKWIKKNGGGFLFSCIYLDEQRRKVILTLRNGQREHQRCWTNGSKNCKHALRGQQHNICAQCTASHFYSNEKVSKCSEAIYRSNGIFSAAFLFPKLLSYFCILPPSLSSFLFVARHHWIFICEMVPIFHTN